MRPVAGQSGGTAPGFRFRPAAACSGRCISPGTACLHGGHRRGVFLRQRHVLVLGAVEDQVQRLALDHLGGQGVEQIFLLQPGPDPARRLVALLGQALDLVVDVVLADVDLLDLGDLLQDEMLLEGQVGAAEHVLLEQALPLGDLLLGDAVGLHFHDPAGHRLAGLAHAADPAAVPTTRRR